jgi:hypothetical protein
MTMSDHFKYLLEEPSHDFFQKVAHEQVVGTLFAPPPLRIVPFDKTASAEILLDHKVDQALLMLESTGPIGLDFGMCKRASVYLHHLGSDGTIDDATFLDVFNKVAAAAIEKDFEAGLEQLCADLPKSLHAEANRQLSKIAGKLVKTANILEEGAHLLEGGKGIAESAKPAESLAETGKSLRPPPGPGIGKRIVNTVKKVPAAFSYARAAVPAAFTHGIPGAFHEAQSAQRGLRAVAKDTQIGKSLGRAEEATSSAGKAYHSRVAENLAKSREGLLAAGAKNESRLNELSGGKGKSLFGEAGEKGRERIREGQKGLDEAAAKTKSEAGEAAQAPKSDTPSAAAAPPKAPKTQTPKERTEAMFADNQAKAKTGGPPPKTRAEATGAAEPPKAEGEGVKGEGEQAEGSTDEEKPAGPIHETIGKFHRGEKLSRAEKLQLGKGGLAAVGAHRVLTGRDLLTGDKND